MIKFTTMNIPIYLLLFMVHFLLSPASSITHPLPPLDSLRGTLFEEKTRLGSRPPSCHNKCNQCHPCMAVQVPTTMPSHDRVVGPGTTRTLPMMFLDPAHNRYSNYKPLGWKCHCGDHFFNP